MASSLAGGRTYLLQVAALSAIGSLLGLWPIGRVVLDEGGSDLGALVAFGIWVVSPYMGFLLVASRPGMGLLYPKRSFVMAGLLLLVTVMMAWPPTDPLFYLWGPVYQWGIVLFATLLLIKRRRIDEAI